MRKDLLSKTLVICGIFLFIGMGVQPAFAKDMTSDKVEQQLENKFSIITNPVSTRGGTFMKTFGGTESDYGYFVQQTSDGGYILTGETESFGAGQDDVWLIKTDSNGNKVWDKTFGGVEDDRGNCVRQTTDGGYIITGIKDDYPGTEGDLWLIKTDSAGNKVWDKTYGEVYDREGGRCVQQTTDGGYIILGEKSGDARLIKTDSSGNKEWDKTIGGSDPDWGNYIQQTSDGGYIITGSTGTYTTYSTFGVWLVKTNSTGNKMWHKTFEKGDFQNEGECVQQTNDGGYIVTGATSEFGDFDAWLIKTDSAGNKEWDKIFDWSESDYSYCVQQTNDGGYIVVGSGGSMFGNTWLLKTDSTGTIVWRRTFGEIRYPDCLFCVQQTTDDGYITTGFTRSYNAYGYSDVWLIKTDENGRSRAKEVSSNLLLLRLLERFPLLQKMLLFY